MIAILLSTLLMAADPTAVTGPSAGPAAPAATASPVKTDGGEVICWEERPTGSHVSQKMCATRDHLDKAKRAADDALSGRVLDKPAPRSLSGH